MREKGIAKKQNIGPLALAIEKALRPGRFIRYNDMWEFVRELESVHAKVASMVAKNEAGPAVDLYELFLSGCYEKSEECDDSSGNLGMFFQDLFRGWVEARQTAGRPASETIDQVLKWMARDNYGFCYRIEKCLAKVLNADGYRLFVAHFQSEVDKGLNELADKSPRAIFEFDNKIRLPALRLKEIYLSKSESRPYAELSERLGLSPLDCERLAEMEISLGHWNDALAWVDKGLALEPARNWHNESSYSLARLKVKVLSRLGRGEDALAQAWKEFESQPSESAFEELLELAPKGKRSEWRDRAMTVAEERDLGSFIGLCVKAKEWKRLAARVHLTADDALEGLSHYCTEPAAKGLAKHDALAAAKLRRALGMRILNSAKSKYYDAALRHFDHARKLCLQAGREEDWQSFVENVRTRHSRKTGFMRAFLSLGTKSDPEAGSSFVEKARERWRKQTA